MSNDKLESTSPLNQLLALVDSKTLSIQESWLDGDISYEKVNFYCVWGLRHYFKENKIDEKTIRTKSEQIYSVMMQWGKEFGVNDNSNNDPLLRSVMGSEPEKQVYELKNPPNVCFANLFKDLVFEKYRPALKLINDSYINIPMCVATIALTEFVKPVIPRTALLEFMEFKESLITHYLISSQLYRKKYQTEYEKLEKQRQDIAKGNSESARVRAENALAKRKHTIDLAIKLWEQNPLWTKKKLIRQLKKDNENEIVYEDSYLNQILVGVKEKALSSKK